MCICFFFQAEDGIRGGHVTGVQTCALPILDGQIALGEIEEIIQSIPEHLPTEQIESIQWNASSEITFKEIDVHLDNNPILKDISFSFKSHGLVGIIGPSGAGKSTLINVLAGF